MILDPVVVICLLCLCGTVSAVIVAFVKDVVPWSPMQISHRDREKDFVNVSH